ncbi:3-keto-steroid reductase [Coccidioides immitis H538.4]|uniref:3-keto-steroid reductase n=1 Tax=Coccidioides immitis H538.4 TaxID=396776 RepID=A0A0J8RU50_COCIT|nr:3-keto-steroid reductase [Coccidioides immitis H538.4]
MANRTLSALDGQGWTGVVCIAYPHNWQRITRVQILDYDPISDPVMVIKLVVKQLPQADQQPRFGPISGVRRGGFGALSRIHHPSSDTYLAHRCGEMGSIAMPAQLGDLNDQVFVLVTGTNSGLGLSICRRLIDEFLHTRPRTQSLTLIFTTRSTRKSNETLAHLQRHLRLAGVSGRDLERITLKPEHVDLCDLLSVRALSRRLLASTPKLDVVVLNAGIAGFSGLNWFRAIYMVLTDLIYAVTWPSSYCISPTGTLVKKQTQLPDEPPLGQLFCANVFGHYMLSHNLVPLLKKSDIPGRIIWTSSLEANREVFDVSDIQGLKTSRAYESVKYLTDILALTSPLPSTAPWVNSFLSSSDDDNHISNGKSSLQDRKLSSTTPSMYVAHPGICATSILPLILPLYYAMIAAFWFARIVGSPWHVLSSYRGAAASVWLALAPHSVIDAAEAAYAALGGGRVKWGSSCDRLGRESVVCTEVEGWGFGGIVGGPQLEGDRTRRRKRGARDLTAEERVEFEELGRRCWREMEELRVRWDGILDRAEDNMGEKAA